jgi:hypothetical protein
MGGMMSTLPQRLILGESGEHVMPAIYGVVETMNVDHDLEEWVADGWEARTYEGVYWYKHKEKAEVLAWLQKNDYEDTGDGAHFLRREDAPLDVSIEAWPLRTGVYSIFSTYAKEALIVTALGLLEIAAYVESHREQLEEEAAARREEIKAEAEE